MGTIYQRRSGGGYYGYWTDVKGQAHRRTLRTHDPVVARARLRELELLPADRAAHGRAPLALALSQLLDVASVDCAGPTVKCYRQKARHLIRVFGAQLPVGDLTRERCIAYAQQRRAEEANDGTIHKELVVLRRALAEQRDRGQWRGDPRAVVPTIRVRYEPRTTWLTPAQLFSLLRELPIERRLWVLLAVRAGPRSSEVEALRWEHVDLARFTLRLPGRKTVAAWRAVPIDPLLAKALRREQVNTVPTPADRVVARWPNVRRDLAAACVRANVPKVTPNDLRRTFASWLKQAGVDSHAVAQLLGHTSARMVERVYGRLDADTLARAVSHLPGARGTEKPVRSGARAKRLPGDRTAKRAVRAKSHNPRRRS